MERWPLWASLKQYENLGSPLPTLKLETSFSYGNLRAAYELDHADFRRFASDLKDHNCCLLADRSPRTLSARCESSVVKYVYSLFQLNAQLLRHIRSQQRRAAEWCLARCTTDRSTAWKNWSNICS
uniref:Uncharacterized protein n=1 Tax=Bionectria ochroleuca TaxID=29856 RepID=A0A0B7JW87_BIOOC